MSPIANGNRSPSMPIPIDPNRRRSASDSDSSESSGSPTTPYSAGTAFPTQIAGNPTRVGPVSPSTSPILSYFLSQAPSKSPTTNSLPFRRNLGPPANDEDDAMPEIVPPPTKHARRASTAWAGNERFSQPSIATPEQHERATGVLRRLSLGGALARPQIPQFKTPTSAGTGVQRSTTPPTMPSTPTPATPTSRKTRRSNTMGPGTQRPPRAPSPMGERILKGHFDSFH